MDRPDWLRLADALQTIASAGLTYSQDPFDRDRFEQVRALAALVLSRHTDLSREEGAARLRAEPGYVTPKVDVRAALLDEDRVLLVREVSDGRWSIPGGWAEVGESPSEVAVREVREETGLSVRVKKLVAVLDKRKHPHPLQLAYVYKLFFLCEEVGGTLRTSFETPGVDWFPRTALPPLSLDRVLPSQVERLFAHRDDPALPTEFD